MNRHFAERKKGGTPVLDGFQGKREDIQLAQNAARGKSFNVTGYPTVYGIGFGQVERALAGYARLLLPGTYCGWLGNPLLLAR